MLQALREIEGGIQLSLNVAMRLPLLRKPPILESFLRQVYFTGATAATGVILRACGLAPLRVVHAGRLLLLDDQEPAVRLRGGGLLLLAWPESARPHPERRAEGGHESGDPKHDAGALDQRGVRLCGVRDSVLWPGQG